MKSTVSPHKLLFFFQNLSPSLVNVSRISLEQDERGTGSTLRAGRCYTLVLWKIQLQTNTVELGNDDFS